jgi:cellulose biosynthesis protein BcsQ
MKDAWSPAVKVYGIVSLSGGQGKTTTAFFLGLHLAERGYKVLFLDADPQANLTFYSGVHLPEGGGDLEKVFRGEDIQGSIYPLSWENLFIIPAGQNLARINEYLASSGNGGRMLDRRLRQIRDWFDYCIIDAPPARSQIVLSVIGASTQIIIPFEVALKGWLKPSHRCPGEHGSGTAIFKQPGHDFPSDFRIHPVSGGNPPRRDANGNGTPEARRAFYGDN